jgi:hypothetical protein
MFPPIRESPLEKNLLRALLELLTSIGLPLNVKAVLRAITKALLIRDRSVVRLSVTPLTKYSCSGPPPMLAKGKTTMESLGGSPRTETGREDEEPLAGSGSSTLASVTAAGDNA